MDRGSERQTLRAVKVSFNAARARARGRVEMNADKNRVPIRIRDRDARAQRNEHVAVACHHDPVAVRLKNHFQSLRHVEIHHAFRNSLPWNSAAIESAVTSVDDNGC